ncbi:hypothetical protein GHT06_012159 [Daphnia sinensis]|uniref:CUB domain-containing protein n=1 Tax=Daphnia sinensis TaxID=1820382 RepID=A0AAD5LFC5_9CRUS|nr:hypothetical protein GHT06_012159 [Daphnia sinensis]
MSDLILLLLTSATIAVCLASPVPEIHHINPLQARSGSEAPWSDVSPSTVHWAVEDLNTPFEASYPAPAPSAGTKYLRAIRNDQLTAGLAILRTETFTAYPGDEISFKFWIRSKYTGGNTLELVMAIGGTEQTLVSLTDYSTSVNMEWRRTSTALLVSAPTDVTLSFYAFCGSSTEDAVAIDDIIFLSPNAPPTTPTTTSTTPPAGVCGGNYNAPSGTFSSPNYPQPYGFNERCEYTIQVAIGKRVVLEFLSFNTEGGSDYVTVRNPSTHYPNIKEENTLYVILCSINCSGIGIRWIDNLIVCIATC